MGEPILSFQTIILAVDEPAVGIGTSNLYIQALILLVSIAAVAFFSSAEASLISVNKLRIRYLAERGNPAARMVNRVVERHEKFFATILLTENAFIIFASSVGTAMAISLVGDREVLLLLAPLIMTVLIVTFGEITPKTLAAGASERWSLVVARPIAVIMFLETTVIYLFTLLPRFILKVMGGRQSLWTPTVTEGELRMLIDIGKEEGAVEPGDAVLLERVFRFGDQHVQDLMTPRPEIIWVQRGDTLREFLGLYADHTFTRFPVYEGTMENVIGTISIKDVAISIGRGQLQPEDSVTDSLRPVYFVPETKTVSSTLAEMRQEGHAMAMAVDEFGGIAGLVTRKQLLEGIFAQLGEEEYIVVDENTFLVDAGVGIADLNEKLELALPEGDYQTVAGFILDRLGRIPEEGAELEYRNWKLTVKVMDGVKIQQIEVRRSRSDSLKVSQ